MIIETKQAIGLLKQSILERDKYAFAAFSDHICFLGFCGIVIFIPFSIAGVEICFTVALIAFLLKRILMRDASLPLSKPIKILMGLFVLSVGISFLRSEYTYLAFRGFIRWWKAFLLVLVASEALSNRRRINQFIKIGVTMLGVASLDGMVQLLLGRDFLRLQTGVDGYYGYMIRAGFGHYNNYSAYLATLLPIAVVGSSLSKKQGDKLAYAGLILVVTLATLALWYTRSRSGWLGVMCGMCFLRMISNSKECRVYILTCFLLLGAIWVRWNFSEWNKFNAHETRDVLEAPIKLQEKVRFKLDSPEEIKTFFRGPSGRLEWWSESLKIALERPFFGYGPNTFSRYFPSGIYAHNSYLQVLVEMGCVGFVLFLAILGRVSFELVSAFSFNGDSDHDLTFLSLMGGLVAFLVHSIFDHTFYVLVLAALFWSLTGAALAYLSLSKAEDASRQAL